jgi:5'-3' exonuclease
MDKILLIDTYNAIYRATSSFGRPPENVKPEDTIVYNFFRNLRPIIELFKPNQLLFVIEGNPEFRYSLYPEYKANRIVKTGSKLEAKENFKKAKAIILNLLSLFPCSIVKADKYECDDVISTLSNQMSNEDITILSNDSDYTQLLQLGFENIKIYDPIKKKYFTSTEYPYVVWKSLAGDKSDNIKSLVPEAQAVELSTDPDKLSAYLDLEENRANFSINHKLIEFANVPEEEIIITKGEYKKDWIKREFKCLGFNSIVNDKSWIKYINTFDCINIV